MATSAELFPGARVSTTRIAPNTRGLRIEPRTGTTIGRDPQAYATGISCKCGCGGYWSVRWDGLMPPHDTVSFLAHDLELMGVVDQLGYRAVEAADNGQEEE